jgi:hypothetical protein
MTAFNLIPVIALLLAALTVRLFADSQFIKSPNRSMQCALLAAGSSVLMFAGLPFGDQHIARGFLFVGLFLFVYFGIMSIAHVDDEPKKPSYRERAAHPVGWRALCLQAIPTA